MKLKRRNLFITAAGLMVGSFLLMIGPHPNNVAMEFSIFNMKLSTVFLALGFAMEE